jgi:hypothetical protein
LITVAQRSQNWNGAFIDASITALNRSTAAVVTFRDVTKTGQYSSDENHNNKHLFQPSAYHFYTFFYSRKKKYVSIIQQLNKTDKTILSRCCGINGSTWDGPSHFK